MSTQASLAPVGPIPETQPTRQKPTQSDHKCAPSAAAPPSIRSLVSIAFGDYWLAQPPPELTPDVNSLRTVRESIPPSVVSAQPI